MAARYWVGGTATWDATAGTKWATTSGGAGGAAVPTAADDVYFDAASGAVTVTTNGTTTNNARSLDFTGFTGTLNHATGTTIRVGDSTAPPGASAWLFVSGMTYTKGSSTTSIVNFLSTNAAVQTVTSAGKTFSSVTFSGAGSSYKFADNFKCSGTLTHSGGTLDFDGKQVEAATFTSNSGSGKTLYFRNSLIIVQALNLSNSGLTFSEGTSTVQIDLFTNVSLNYSGVNLYDLVFIGGANNVRGTIPGSGTLHNLTFTTTYDLNMFQINNNMTITGTFTMTGGNSTGLKRLSFSSQTPGVVTIVTAAAVSLTDVNICALTGAGAATWSGTRLGDCGANTNITFQAPENRYWVGGTGNWSNPAKWASTSGGSGGAGAPMPQDNVYFDANSFTAGSQTVTGDMDKYGRNIDFTGVTNTPTFVPTATSPQLASAPGQFLGNLTLTSSMVWSASAATMHFVGCFDSILTTGGLAMRTVVINKKNPFKLTLGDTYTSVSGATGIITCTLGNLDTNNQTVTIENFSFGSSFTSITFGSSVVTLTGTSGVLQPASINTAINAGTSEIIVSNTSTTAKFFDTNGKKWNKVTITGDNVRIGSNNGIITWLNIMNAGLPNGTKFQTSSRYNILRLTTNGAPGSIAKIGAQTNGQTYNVAGMGEKISLDYVSIQDMTFTSGVFFAGANSTNVSNNVGIIFATGDYQSNPNSFTPLVMPLASK